MSRFGYILISYVIYLSVIIAGNTASFIMDKPVQALGMISKWWFIASVFLVAYISEWGSILYEKQ